MNTGIKHFVISELENGSALTSGYCTYILDKQTALQANKYFTIANILNNKHIANFEFDQNEYEDFLSSSNQMGWNFERPSLAEANKILIPQSEAIQIFDAAKTMWAPLPACHRIFDNIFSNKVLAIYFIIEHLWYIKSAGLYLGSAYEKCTNSKHKSILGKIYHEEKDHYKKISQSIGISDEALSKYDASSGARGLVGYLFMQGCIDPKSLILNSCLFEASTDEIDKTSNFYKEIGELIGVDLSGFTEHSIEDVNCDHVNIWKEIFFEKQTYTYGEISNYIADLHSAKHMIDGWYDSIISLAHYYGSLLPDANKTELEMYIRPQPEAGSIFTHIRS